MSFISMAKELQGDIPGISLPYAQTLINRALDAICKEQRWSFLLGEGGWLIPPAILAGTVTVAPFTNTVQGDATAAAAWNALQGLPFLTQRQFRVGTGALYNIVAYDGVNTLTLDRPWMDPAATLSAYMIYQAYVVVPTPRFRGFRRIRDTINGRWLDYQQRDQKWLDRHDPLRQVFDIPVSVVAYRPDTRPGSATAGNMMYEMWPHPTSQGVYPYTFLFDNVQLSAPSDTVPYPLSEELVQWRAKEMGFLWKEAQKGDGMERGSGADWKFLSQEAHEQMAGRLKQAKLLDEQLGTNLYWDKFERYGADVDTNYVTQYGQTNVGVM